MDPGWLALLPMLIGGVVMVVAQIGVIRISGALPLLRAWVFGVVAGLCFVLGTTGWICFLLGRNLADSLIALFTNGAIFACVAYGYFHFVNLGETARRIRILWELRESADGLSYHDILSRYDSAEIIDRRIHRLINTGQIIDQNGRLYATGTSVLLMAKILSLLKRVFLRRATVDIGATSDTF